MHFCINDNCLAYPYVFVLSYKSFEETVLHDPEDLTKIDTTSCQQNMYMYVLNSDGENILLESLQIKVYEYIKLPTLVNIGILLQFLQLLNKTI